MAGGDILGNGVISDEVYILDFENPNLGWIQKASMPRGRCMKKSQKNFLRYSEIVISHRSDRTSGNAWINPLDSKEYVYLFGGTNGRALKWTKTWNIDK